MIGRGWDHPSLVDMAEADFLWWLGRQIEYDEEVEAARRAAEEQRSK